MGRAEKRAKRREDAERTQGSAAPARDPGAGTLLGIAAEHPQTHVETARRIYRTGGKPVRRAKTVRRASDKPRKWREGHQ